MASEGQDQQHDDDEADPSARVVAPISTMRPRRRGTDGHDDEDDEQQCEHGEMVIIVSAKHDRPSARGLSADGTGSQSGRQ